MNNIKGIFNEALQKQEKCAEKYGTFEPPTDERNLRRKW